MQESGDKVQESDEAGQSEGGGRGHYYCSSSGSE